MCSLPKIKVSLYSLLLRIAVVSMPLVKISLDSLLPWNRVSLYPALDQSVDPWPAA